MDDVVKRFARELADAIAGAVSDNPEVEACRERARAAGFDVRLTLEAVVGFSSVSDQDETSNVQAPAQLVPGSAKLDAQSEPPPFDVTANDKRFLRSLRIAVDEAAEEVE